MPNVANLVLCLSIKKPPENERVRVLSANQASASLNVMADSPQGGVGVFQAICGLQRGAEGVGFGAT
jgi:hypothetical protein